MEYDDEDGLEPDEEALLDSIFHHCDQNNTGKVKVSRLIEYLSENAVGGNSPTQVSSYQR